MKRGSQALLALLLLAGCQSLRLTPPAADKMTRPERELAVARPGKHSVRVSQFVFLSDFELKRDLPLFQELSDLRDQVYKDLQLPAANTVVKVYLLEDEKRYERFMQARYPELPRRRAFFVAQPHSVGGTEELLVYTFWGESVRKDLRHELTHALLHCVLKDVPLWLDEGLAEFYEMPPERLGINHAHLVQLRENGYQGNLARLEQLSQVQQMTPAEYREAWAWAHLMLRGKPEARAVLLKYLQQLRTNPTPGPLQPKLAEVFPVPEEALESHLIQLTTDRR